jgi:hypothetical protein
MIHAKDFCEINLLKLIDFEIFFLKSPFYNNTSQNYKFHGFVQIYVKFIISQVHII